MTTVSLFLLQRKKRKKYCCKSCLPEHERNELYENRRHAAGDYTGCMLPDSKWASAVPEDEIPATLSALAALQGILAARLLDLARQPETNAELVDAKEMARRLQCPESWIRSAARQGKIPVVMIGRYPRFDPAAVIAARKQTK